MASPQTENGFVQIALDLFVALFTSDLPANDAVVLCWVLLQCYGPYKRRSVHLDFAEIEDMTGIERHNARRAAKSLVAAGYLAEAKDGTYRPLKDWENFHPKRGAFVDRLKLARFAEAVLTNPKFNTPKASKRVGVQSDPPDRCKQGPIGPTLQVSGGSTQTPTTVYIGDRHQGANGDTNGTCGDSLACGRAPASEDIRDGEIGVLTDSKQPDGRWKGEPTISFQGLVDAAEMLFGPDISDLVSENQKEITTHFGDRLGCYLVAMQEAKQSRKTIESPLGWFFKVGKRYLAVGPKALSPKIRPTPPATIPLTPAQERRRQQNEMMDRIGAEIAQEAD